MNKNTWPQGVDKKKEIITLNETVDLNLTRGIKIRGCARFNFSFLPIANHTSLLSFKLHLAFTSITAIFSSSLSLLHFYMNIWRKLFSSYDLLQSTNKFTRSKFKIYLFL